MILTASTSTSGIDSMLAFRRRRRRRFIANFQFTRSRIQMGKQKLQTEKQTLQQQQQQQQHNDRKK